MDFKPPVDLEDIKPDPVLDKQKGDKNVDVPGKGKKYLAIFIGLLVCLLLVGVMGFAMYLVRDFLPEPISEYMRYFER